MLSYLWTVTIIRIPIKSGCFNLNCSVIFLYIWRENSLSWMLPSSSYVWNRKTLLFHSSKKLTLLTWWVSTCTFRSHQCLWTISFKIFPSKQAWTVPVLECYYMWFDSSWFYLNLHYMAKGLWAPDHLTNTKLVSQTDSHHRVTFEVTKLFSITRSTACVCLWRLTAICQFLYTGWKCHNKSPIRGCPHTFGHIV